MTTLRELLGDDQELKPLTGWRCVMCGGWWPHDEKPDDAHCCATPVRAKLSAVVPKPSWERGRA